MTVRETKNNAEIDSQPIIDELDSQIYTYKNELDQLNDNRVIKVIKAMEELAETRPTLASVFYIPKRVIRKTKRVIFEPIQKKQKQNILKKVLKEKYNLNNFNKVIKKNKVINIGLVMREGDVRPQSSAFIRLIAPLSKLDQSSYNIVLFNGDLSNSKSRKFRNINVFIVQRTAFSTADNAKNFISDCIRFGIPYFVDLDDAVGLLEKDHPQYEVQKPGLEALNIIIKSSKKLFVSVPELKKYYPSNGSIVIPNTVDGGIWSIRTKEKSYSKALRMVYMGTQTHSMDLELIIPALDRLLLNYPGKFSLTIIGIAKNVPHRSYIQTLNPTSNETLYPNFINWFESQSISFDIGLAPLTNTKFNSAKSDIKCLDYLMAGCGILASNIKPYISSDILDYIQIVEHDGSWYEELEKLIVNKEHFSRTIKKAQNGREYILSSRNVSDASSKLETAIVNSLNKS